MITLFSSYPDVWDIFKRYWNSYGGVRSFAKSPYFHISLLITSISFSIWTKSGWWDLPTSILPNLIGFSLGGYAVWLSFGNDKFRAWLCKSRKSNVTAFMQVNSAFVHFIIIQILALSYAIVAKSLPLFHAIYLLNGRHDPSALNIWTHKAIFISVRFGWFIGVLLFVYAVLSGLAATIAVFRFSYWLEIFIKNGAPKKPKKSKHVKKFKCISRRTIALGVV